MSATAAEPANPARGRRWIDARVRELDPVEDSAEAMRLITGRLLPRVGGSVVLNLFYTLTFHRFATQLEGGAAVDRAGKGYVHRNPDKRADDTVIHIAGWIQHGAHSEHALASLKRVRSMHEHYARQYSMSNETFVHTIAVFTLQYERFLRLIGAPGFSEREKLAQLTHWRAVGAALGTEDMPDTWEGMERFLAWYEASPEWFGRSAAGVSCARALEQQFLDRWVPRPLHAAGRWFLRSLLEDHVREAAGHPRPPAAAVRAVRLAVRAAFLVNARLPDPRTLPDPSSMLAGRYRESGYDPARLGSEDVPA